MAASDAMQDNELKGKAQAYFALGESLFESGNYDESAEAFLRAYDTYPHYSVLANVGLAYERSGEYPLAVFYFRKYMTALKRTGKDNPRVEAVLDRTINKVSDIVVSIEGFCDECRILLDEKNRGESPIEAVVHPGSHRIQVVSEGETYINETLYVAPGETRRFIFSKLNVLKSQDNVEPASSGMGMPFWVATASAISAVVASGALWGATFKTKHAFDEQTEIAEKRDLKDKGQKLQISAAVTAGIAGVAALTAAVLATVRSVSKKKEAKNGRGIEASRNMLGIQIRF